ncbi:hypothetical protein ADK58_14985 [Streptomyces sp. XY152]|nr:hypothetical protein ADK58_14985 [Streptomyces sp. XY152]
MDAALGSRAGDLRGGLVVPPDVVGVDRDAHLVGGEALRDVQGLGERGDHAPVGGEQDRARLLLAKGPRSVVMTLSGEGSLVASSDDGEVCAGSPGFLAVPDPYDVRLGRMRSSGAW